MTTSATLTEAQLSACIGILKAGRVMLSITSESEYVAAATFIFENGLLFFPGVALQDLEEEQARRSKAARP